MKASTHRSERPGRRLEDDYSLRPGRIYSPAELAEVPCPACRAEVKKPCTGMSPGESHTRRRTARRQQTMARLLGAVVWVGPTR